MTDLRDAIVLAYIAGATDVHNNWQEDRDPCFKEAASDYADSLNLSAMQDSGAIGELTQELIAIRVAALNGEDDALDVILAATERALYASKAKSQ